MESFRTVFINRAVWKVPIWYDDLQPIGSGGYGAVCRARDTRAGENVAIKKLHNVFGSDQLAKRALREICLLRFLNHDNIILLKDVFLSQVPGRPEPDIYIVAEFMASDLFKVNQDQSLGMDHIQSFVYQMLCALQYIHSAGVIHRDLKTSNVVCNAEGDLKLVDFGLARGMMAEAVERFTLTDYVATRYYRAAEVFVTFGNYGPAMDMWSLGCIMAELITGVVLFREDNLPSMLNSIFSLCGFPSDSFLARIPNEKVQEFVSKMTRYERKNFHEVFRCPPMADQEERDKFHLAIDLLDRLLVVDPEERMSARDALSHPFMAEWHDPTDRAEFPAPEPFVNEFEDQQLSEDSWRRLIYTKVLEYHTAYYAHNPMGDIESAVLLEQHHLVAPYTD